eukprot:TRINITY_DN970_c0_g1_i3.p1 TRINITY_DN970_c0_g1~~TRINITY_DN970_c0_g1_i3.p1  ORF type:complete len:907 (+),score=274.26 TRINITY_DN970_c0_g1_i3:36-2723(+)
MADTPITPMTTDAVSVVPQGTGSEVLPLYAGVDFEEDSSDDEEDEELPSEEQLHGLLRDGGVMWRARLQRSFTELAKDPQLLVYYRRYYWGVCGVLDGHRVNSTGFGLKDHPTPDNILSKSIAGGLRLLPVVGAGMASWANMLLGKRFPNAYNKAERSVMEHIVSTYNSADEMIFDVKDVAIAMTYLRRHHFCDENLPDSQADQDVLRFKQFVEGTPASAELAPEPAASDDRAKLRRLIGGAYAGQLGIENARIPRQCFREVIDLTAPLARGAARMTMGMIGLAWTQTKNIVSILVKIPLAKHVRVHVSATNVHFKCIDNFGRRCIAALPMKHGLSPVPETDESPHEITSMDELLRIDCKKAEDSPAMWENLVSRPVEETADWLQPQSFDDALLECMGLMQALSIRPRSNVGTPATMLETPLTIQTRGTQLRTVGGDESEVAGADTIMNDADASAIDDSASPLSINMHAAPSGPPALPGLATPYTNLLFTPASAIGTEGPTAKRRRMSVAPSMRLSMATCVSQGMASCASDVACDDQVLHTPAQAAPQGSETLPLRTPAPAAASPASTLWTEVRSLPESVAAQSASADAAAVDASPAVHTGGEAQLAQPEPVAAPVPQAEAPETPVASAPAPWMATSALFSAGASAPRPPRPSMGPRRTPAHALMSPAYEFTPTHPEAPPRASVSYANGRPSLGRLSVGRVAGVGSVKSNVPVRRAMPYPDPRMSVGRRGGLPHTPVTPASVLKKPNTRMSTACASTTRNVRFSLGGDCLPRRSVESLCETPDVAPLQPHKLCLSGNTSPPTPATSAAAPMAYAPPHFVQATEEIDRDDSGSLLGLSQDRLSQEMPHVAQEMPHVAQEVPQELLLAQELPHGGLPQGRLSQQEMPAPPQDRVLSP